MSHLEHQPTRMSNGISTGAAGGTFENYPNPDPTKFYSYFNDFMVYAAGDWTVTETDAGATEALADGAGGHLLITNTAADNDVVVMQLVKEAFKLVSGKRAFFECRFKVSDATQTDVIMGLCITDTSPVASAPSDGIYFRKDDGDANLDFISHKDSAGTESLAFGTLVDDTFVKLGFYFDGTNVTVYKDGAAVSRKLAITFCDNEELTVTMALQAGEAVAKTMTVDYIFAAIER